MSEVDLQVKIGGMTLKNPVLVSSGTFGYGAEFSDFFDLNLLGGLITKAISPKPRPGNPPPRTIETPSGLLNAIGLENCGLKTFIEDKLPYLSKLDTNVIVNVAGASEDDYVEVVTELSDREGVAGFEINISCPNVSCGGIEFGTRPESAAALVMKLRKLTGKTLVVKLSPNVTDIVEIARAAEGAGADALSLVNTFRGMAISLQTGRPVLGNRTGGLSGPAIKPLALYNVFQVSLHVKLPVIGMGGISNFSDAMEFIYAGADAVSVGTANFVNPTAPVEIIEGIRTFCVQHGIQNIGGCVGKAHG